MLIEPRASNFRQKILHNPVGDLIINANIAGVRQEQLNNKYPENMKHEVREHVSFTYQKIIWVWEDGGIMAEDDWETPNV